MADITSAQTGNWSATATWVGGVLPGTTDRAVIAEGHTVTLNQDATISGAVIHGTLVFQAAASRTLISNATNIELHHGTLRMRPSTVAQVHTLRFTNVDETLMVGGGVEVLATDVGLWVGHHDHGGTLDILGAAKTAWTRLAAGAVATDTVLTMESAPTGWQIGDTIAIAPTEHPVVGNRSWNGFEKRVITAIDGAAITIDTPLAHAHPVAVEPFGAARTFTAEVLNLTRNVIIEGTGDGTASFNPANNGRAHIMFMAPQTQTIKYCELRLLGPRGPHHRDPTEGVLGRYPIHFHLLEDATRGSLIEGVVAHNCGNHAFVPHKSHGITFRHCIAYDNWEDAFWWDQSGGLVGDNSSDDTLYDHNIAALIKDDPDGRGFELTGFLLEAGFNNRVQDSVSVGVQGTGTSSGFHWPGKANQEEFNVWGFDQGNISHNNKGKAIFVWQNDLHEHKVENFVGYHNKKGGIDHGAYGNVYQYIDVSLFGNDDGDEVGLKEHAGAFADLPFRVDEYVMAFEDFLSTEKLEFVTHKQPFLKPAVFLRAGFPAIVVNDTSPFNNPTRADFVRCINTNTGLDLEAADFSYLDVEPAMDIRVQRADGTAFRITHDGVTPTVTDPIAAFYQVGELETNLPPPLARRGPRRRASGATIGMLARL